MKVAFSILLTFFLSSIAYAGNLQEKQVTMPFSQGQTWKGTYNCGEGNTTLYLKVSAPSAEVSEVNADIYANFEFKTLRGITGAFSMVGKYDPIKKQANFSPIKWLAKPNVHGYAMVKLTGQISDDGRRYKGSLVYRGCRGFEVYLDDSTSTVLLSNKNTTANKTLTSSSLFQQGVMAAGAKEVEKSKILLEQYLQKYPNGEFAAHANLIRASQEMAIQNNNKAYGFLMTIINDFPKSEVAEQAKKVLPTLNLSNSPIVSSNPRAGLDIFQKAQQARARRDYDQAIPLFNQFIKQYPQSRLVTSARQQLDIIDKDLKKQEFAKNEALFHQNKAKQALAQKVAEQKAARDQKTNNFESGDQPYRFELVGPLPKSRHVSFSVHIYFRTFKELIEHANELNEILKKDLTQRSQSYGGINKLFLGSRYTVFAEGKIFEWVDMDYHRINGWTIKKSSDTVSSTNNTLSILNEALDFTPPQKSAKNYQDIFRLGFFVSDGTSKMPTEILFKANGHSTSKRKVGFHKRYQSTSKNYSFIAEIQDAGFLFLHKDKLLAYVKQDFITRIQKENTYYDELSISYQFKMKTETRHITLRKSMGVLNIISLDTWFDSFESLDEDTRKMRLAKLNGNTTLLHKYQKKMIASTSSETFEKSTLFKGLDKTLSDIDKLPLQYSFEAKKLSSILSRQPLVRQLINKYPFPLKGSSSLDLASKAQHELMQLTDKLKQQGENIIKTSSGGKHNGLDISIAQQRAYAKTIYYPGVVDIQSKTIEMLSLIPRTEAGFKQAQQIYKWLSLGETDYNRPWFHIFKNTGSGNSWGFSKICDDFADTPKDMVGGDDSSGRCVLNIPFQTALLRDTWRIQYLQVVDKILAEKANNEGPDLNIDIFNFVLDPSDERTFMNGLFKISGTPPESNQRCIKDDCSSKIMALYQSEVNSNTFTAEREQRYFSILDKNANDFLQQIKSISHLSKDAQFSLRSEIAQYARSKASLVLRRLVDSAIINLEKISIENSEGLRVWNEQSAKPIRLLLEKWQVLFEFGFYVSTQDKVVKAYGLTYKDGGTVGSMVLDNLLYQEISDSMFDRQYKWFLKSDKNTIADGDTEVPDSWWDGSTTSNVTYSKPRRHYGRLMTPTEVMFEGIGEQAGRAAASFISYAGQIKLLEMKVIKTRKQFFECYPDCSSIHKKRIAFSKALVEKDLYFLEISGRSGSVTNDMKRRMAVVTEGATGTQGFSIVDGGISHQCRGYFDKWVATFKQNQGRNGDSEMFLAIDALGKMMKGDFLVMKRLGDQLITKQRKVFKASSKEYGKYQVCRDQWEFDHR